MAENDGIQEPIKEIGAKLAHSTATSK